MIFCPNRFNYIIFQPKCGPLCIYALTCLLDMRFFGDGRRTVEPGSTLACGLVQRVACALVQRNGPRVRPVEPPLLVRQERREPRAVQAHVSAPARPTAALRAAPMTSRPSSM